VTEIPAVTRFARTAKDENVQRVGVLAATFIDAHQFAAIAAQFPNVRFEEVAGGWPDGPTGAFDLLLAPLDAADAAELDGAARWLRRNGGRLQAVILLRNADVSTTRALLREGAADVIPAPASETTITVTLDKLLGAEARRTQRRAGGEIIAVLKAGGGVGATSIAVQAAAMAAHRGTKVCLVDLDLQFGAASVYLDLPDATTVADCMSAGTGLSDIDFGALLAKHRSGLSLLAAPRQVTPLEALAPPQTEALLSALQARFDLVIVDLPAVWTAWTNRALQMANRIVVVTQLSVPHMHLLDRQLTTLRAQGLEDRSPILVCNALNAEQATALSVKAAEKALGRSFDIVAPEDRKLMLAAINQGVELSDIRRGTKLEKSVAELAAMMAGQTAAAAGGAPKRRWL
jgi:pilus assembly protein CpaE